MFASGLLLGLLLGLFCFYVSYSIAVYFIHKIEEKEENNG